MRGFTLADDADTYIRRHLPRDIGQYDDAALAAFMTMLVRGRTTLAEKLIEAAKPYLDAVAHERLVRAAGVGMPA
ncbi:hypothetical protein KSF73_06890 [Burkholderiaceae bacterium DAT-1]|nr:hypothetical protein [Burkholderiaceae bacterium DAT-1]